jgi:hypothetical protein
MTPASILNMVKKYTDKYGVIVTWRESVASTNSRGKPVAGKSETDTSARVLLLKEKFSPLKITDTGVIGLGRDYTRYILALPEVALEKDMIITDNRAMKWKLGFIDWFDVGGVPVCKQTTLTEVA